jgi:tetratricopeptide (TPR) repeat protein
MLLRFLPFLKRPARDRALVTAKAECYLSLVFAGFFINQIECALAVLMSANYAARLGDGPHLSYAYSHLSFMLYGLAWRRVETARDYARRALSMAESFQLPVHRGYAYQSMTFLDYLEGRWEDGCESALKGIAQFRAHGDMYCVGSSYCALLLHYQGRGMLGAARQAAQEGLEIIERVGALAVSTPVSMKHGMLLTDVGNGDVGVPKVRAAIEAVERMEDPTLRAWVRLLLGHCHFARGEIDAAIEQMEVCVEIRRRFDLSADFLSPRVYPLLSRAYVEKARVASDSRSRSELLRRARRHAEAATRSTKRRATFSAAALLANAECLWEEGKEADARALFDRSIKLAEAQGSRMMLADAHYELGRRLHNVDDARRYLQTALDLYDACDAVPYVQSVRRAMDMPRQASS